MSKTVNILCSACVAMLAATGGFAAANASRSAVNTENIRAAGTVANPRVKQTTPRDSAVRSGRGIVARSTTNTNRDSISSFDRANNIISDAGRIIVRRVLGLGNGNADAKRSGTAARTAKNMPGAARVATMPAGASRSRATAVFSDISKMGDGYNNCRQAYNTCMDQFCAGANETYRRCFCSNTFRDLRDKEEALDAATTMLAKFEDNYLTAVDKSAEEVNAMYSATVGEAAIKNDTSAAAALLNDIGDLLSGKTKAKVEATNSLGGMSVDFSSDLGDIWADTSSNSLFGGGAADLSQLEGIDLYNQSHSQCMQLVADTCNSAAVKNMAKSAYGILITQDCNAYQKKLETKTEKVKTTVRQAEKYLREARLEEYRSHNSSDVNDCMDKVEKAILADTACGADYMKCLDHTGVYINMSTGEPIYSARLFKMNELIVLDGQSADVLAQNPDFNKFLDTKRIYAKSALDTCRTIADTVWSEFKRNALIKISQAQDEKIEEVKMSCVSTMKECYDTQSAALKGFDDTTAQASGALAARASKDMCVDKVAACAALYAKAGDEQCKVDAKTGQITNADKCGLASLRNFVDNVDDVRIAEGCANAVENYLKQLCTPTAGNGEYPWNCRLRSFGNDVNTWSYRKGDTTSIKQMVINYAYENCMANTSDELEPRIKSDIEMTLSDMRTQLEDQLFAKCSDLDGLWISAGVNMSRYTGVDASKTVSKFYTDVFGGRDSAKEKSLGVCYENTTMLTCLNYNADGQEDGDMARYDAEKDECVFTDKWYEQQCLLLGEGYFENGVCYVKK